MLEKKLEMGAMSLVAAPPRKYCGHLNMPDQEHIIEIRYGLNYDIPLTIPAPEILLEWYQNCHTKNKSARSAISHD
jgi:hypothetical protein